MNIALEAPRYTPPFSIKRLVDLVEKEPNDGFNNKVITEWDDVFNRWVDSRPQSFFEKRGIDIILSLKKIPFKLFEKILLTNKFSEQKQVRREELMKLAVSKISRATERDITNMIQNGFYEGILENPYIDLNSEQIIDEKNHRRFL